MRLKGFRGNTRTAKGFARSNARNPQRVIVKLHVARHKPGKARGSLSRHASYLGRDSASADGQPGVFYDASRDAVDAKKAVVPWTADRHHFRVIISPERGEDIPDMTSYVRQVMARVEKDLDTRLSWLGINHHNTDNPHAHIVIRGRREDGTDLVIPREYLSSGMRGRASEVATELLGERTVKQMHEARLKEVQAERFTSLDRMIERHLENGRINVSPTKSIGYGADDRKLVLGRLQFLETLELARKDGGTWWAVEPDFGPSLRDLGARHDIVKQLYSTLGAEAGRVHRMGGGSEPPTPAIGVVVAKGSADEVTDDLFVVVRDAAGQAHYGRVSDGDSYRSVRVGSIAELGAGALRRREVTTDILTVAKEQGGVYSAQAHETYLRSVHSDLTDEPIEQRIRSATARLGFVAGYGGSGVRAIEAGRYEVNGTTFAQFSQRANQRTDLRVASYHTLDEQVEARAFTWLDRQGFGAAPDKRLTELPRIQDAQKRRNQWLVENGYAERSVGLTGDTRLLPGAINRLNAEERSAADQRLSQRHGLPVAELPNGGTVTGTYRGVEQLHAGRRAIVETDQTIYVAPIRRAPEADSGSTVTLRRTGDRDATVKLAAGRSRGTGAQLYLDGMEAGL
jgi:hypothetical protein